MLWELTVAVSLWRREKWNDDRINTDRPEAEAVFAAGLGQPNNREEIERALIDCTRQCEIWLKQRGASLVTHCVVTVYSLEIA